MRRRLGLAALLCSVLVAGAFRAEGAIPSTERDALIALYDDTGGPQWTNRADWLGPPGTECSWAGVKCDAAKSTVTELWFLYNNLRGVFPRSILKLPNLQAFVVSEATLSGSIPPEIGQLRELRTLQLVSSGLTGSIPPEIGSLSKLEFLSLNENQFRGDIPPQIANLRSLKVLGFSHADFSTIPPELGTMTALENLDIRQSGLEGEIPASLSNLVNLTHLYLGANNLTGPIPDLSRMTKLSMLDLSSNPGLHGSLSGSWFRQQKLKVVGLRGVSIDGSLADFIHPELLSLTLEDCGVSGPIPHEIETATKLYQLRLPGNRLTGEIPEALYDMPALLILMLSQNQLTGGLSSAVGRSRIEELSLASNLLSGPLPPEIARLSGLRLLNLAQNNFRGDVPVEYKTLPYRPYLFENALTARDPALLSFLDGTPCCSFSSVQTVPPRDLAVDGTGSYSVTLRWTPIAFSQFGGGYQVLASTATGGPYAPLLTTPDKYAWGATITGLTPATRYYFIVKTVTFPHGGSVNYQPNTVFSDASAEVATTTSPAFASPPSVIVSAMPSGLVQITGEGGAVDSYSLTNVGGTPTVVTLTKNGAFFVQSPESFTLEPGATQRIALTSATSASGSFLGESIASGLGVAVRVGVTLVSAPRPQGTPRVVADRTRLDLVAPASSDPKGEIVYTNMGDAAFDGVVSADVEFLVPDKAFVSIAAGASVRVGVTSVRQRRPDAALLNGSQAGRLTLISISSANGTRYDAGGEAAAPPSLAAPVGVTDTVRPPTSASLIPDLAVGEVGLTIPGVGHVVGSVGTFVSDVSILNSSGSAPIGDLKLYFEALQGSGVTQASMNTVPSTATVGLADVVSTVFGDTSSVGTIHVRSTRARDVAASAIVFNTSNAAGNFGSAIPVFRSDRGATVDAVLVLTGLRKNDTAHTNLYVQETGGKAGEIAIDFLDAAGSVVGRRTEQVGRFAMLRLLDPLSNGTVAARIRNVSAGRIVAYATPVDRASGDTWAVADWSSLYGFEPGEPVVIPVGGSVRGANDTHFRTDVAITNRCSAVDTTGKSSCRSTEGIATLRFYGTDGSVRDRKIVLGMLKSLSFDDVLVSAFGIDTDVVGHFAFVPESGEWALTSRTYTIVSGQPATFGSSVPALGVSTALRSRQSRRIGGLRDTTRGTIVARTPATSRTNFGIVEVGGEDATVRVSVFFNDARSLATEQRPVASKDYVLAARQLITVSNLVEALLGPSRETLYGDLNDVQVSFEVTSATGAVMVYSSSVDNGTGDSVIRTE